MRAATYLFTDTLMRHVTQAKECSVSRNELAPLKDGC